MMKEHFELNHPLRFLSLLVRPEPPSHLAGVTPPHLHQSYMSLDCNNKRLKNSHTGFYHASVRPYGSVPQCGLEKRPTYTHAICTE